MCAQSLSQLNMLLPPSLLLGGIGLPIPDEVWNPEQGEAVPGAYVGATSKWYRASSGLWVDAGVGNARVEHVIQATGHQGYLAEKAMTALNTFRRDLTNVVWTASNCTPVKNATGIDGAANAATTVTSNNAFSTIIRDPVTSASGNHTHQAWVRRISGTGIIEMTLDGGTSWTDVTVDVSATYDRVSFTATVVNPSIGFRFGDSGDVFEIDAASCSATGFAASPLLGDDTATITRNRDEITSPYTVPGDENYTVLVSTTFDDQQDGESRSAIGLANSTTVVDFTGQGTLIRAFHAFNVSLSATPNVGTYPNGFRDRRFVGAGWRNSGPQIGLTSDITIPETDTDSTLPSNSQAGSTYLIGMRSGGTQSLLGTMHKVEWYFQDLDQDTVIALIGRLVEQAPP